MKTSQLAITGLLVGLAYAIGSTMLKYVQTPDATRCNGWSCMANTQIKAVRQNVGNLKRRTPDDGGTVQDVALPLPPPPLPRTARLTIVLMGYSVERLSNYPEVFGAYANADPDVVEKVVFVWNNQEHDPPPFPTTSTTPFVLLRPPTNSMLNRFNVTHVVGTTAVLLLDDDVLVKPELIKCMWQYWKREPHRIVGLDLRVATEDGEYGHGRQPELHTCEANIIIGKTMLFATRYLEAFLDDRALVALTTATHCEDIAMNALILHATNQTALWVRMDNVYDRIEGNKAPEGSRMTDSGALSSNYLDLVNQQANALGLTAGLDSKRELRKLRDKKKFARIFGKSWFDERSKCVELMINHFGAGVFKPRQHGIHVKGGGHQGGAAEMAECCPGPDPAVDASKEPFSECVTGKGVNGWKCGSGPCMGDHNGYNTCDKVRLHMSYANSNSGNRCRPVSCVCTKA